MALTIEELQALLEGIDPDRYRNIRTTVLGFAGLPRGCAQDNSRSRDQLASDLGELSQSAVWLKSWSKAMIAIYQPNPVIELLEAIIERLDVPPPHPSEASGTEPGASRYHGDVPPPGPDTVVVLAGAGFSEPFGTPTLGDLARTRSLLETHRQQNRPAAALIEAMAEAGDEQLCLYTTNYDCALHVLASKTSRVHFVQPLEPRMASYHPDGWWTIREHGPGPERSDR